MTEEEKNEVYKKAFEIACSNRVLSFNDLAIDALFKAVKKTLGNDVISRIEHSKRDKVILIPSNDNELAKGIVSYIWYTHPPVRVGGGYQYICLRYWNCSRLQEKQIEQDLTKWYLEMHENRTPPLRPTSPFTSNIDLTEKRNLNDRWKSIWFLQNIKEGYLKVFERLLKIANEYKLGDERSLIVSTDKVDNLPQELSRQFELIKPEIEEKSIPASTPQDTAKQAKFIPFPTPSGTQWCEVKISFIDNDNVKLSARDVTEKRHYSEMGFKDNKSKNNEPIFLWKFLKELASLSGRFTNCPDKEKDKAKKYFSSLRKTLSQLFNINGDPIPYKKSKDYTGYETAFVIENKSHDREYEESVRGHHREYIPPKKTHHSCRDENENDNKDNNYNLDG